MARRILLLITDLEIGGTPTVVRELAVRLNQQPEVVVEVACLAPWGPVADQLRAAGVRVTALGARGAADLPVTIWRLIRLVRRGRFDTMLCFLIHANAVGAIASVFAPGVRFLQSIQTTQPEPRWHWRLQRLVQAAADVVVVPSPSAARAARRWAGVPARKVVVIPNGADVATASASPVPAQDPRPYPIGFLGRLDPVKRIPDLLRAVALLGDLVHLHVFGEGRDRPQIEQEVERLGIASRVTLHGAVPSPADAMRGIGLLVLPSEAEGFGLVLIEAMASGVPVVATDVDGIRDVVWHGRTGVLVPVARPEALADAIRRAVEDRDLRRRLIETGLREARERYSWDRILADYRRLLRVDSPLGVAGTG